MRLRALLFALLGILLLATATRPARAQQQDQVITCASDDGQRHYCNADTRNGVSLGRQHSDSPCVQGRTWGYDRRGIWVDRGCRADFVLETGSRGGDGAYGGGRRNDDDDRNGRDNNARDDNGRDNSGRTITCSSDDGERHRCSADTSRGVQLVNQRSGAACVEGRTWGYDRRGIWVDKGCRADFAVR